MDEVGRVDYRGLLERYKEVDNLTFDGSETKQDIIDRLMEVSKEKKKIQTENNEIIKEYITKYEKNPESMDAETEKMFQDFMSMIMEKSGVCIDAPIALRGSKLLLQYYQRGGDQERIITTLERCTVFDIIMKEHLDDYEGSVHPLMAEQYLDDFDSLSEAAQRSLVNCWFFSVINRGDMTYGLKNTRK